MASRFICFLGIFLWTTCHAQTIPSGESTTSSVDFPEPITVNGTMSTTTKFVPRYIIDAKLPVPRNVKKRISRATVITIEFLPPTTNYLNDKRYSHFRIEYQNDNDDETQSIEVKKTNFEKTVMLIGLRSGVLYEINVRTLGRDPLGNYLLSFKSQPIKIRTHPPPVTNLRITPVKNRLSEVMVAWDGSPTSIKGPRYDLFTLSYRIIDDLTSPQKFKYRKQPIDIPHKQNAFDLTSSINVTQIVEVELGATYEFSIVVKSRGTDPTKSSPLKITYKVPVPGPTSVQVLSYDKTSIFVEWENHRDVTDITEHILSYVPALKESQSSRESKNIRLPLATLKYNITGLLPGILYSVSIKCLRKDVPFGNETEETSLYARTAPSLPVNIVINNITMNKAIVNIQPNITSGKSIIVEYELLENENKTTPTRVSHGSKIESIPLEKLSPGALYRINVTLVSEPPIQTAASVILFTRTMPEPPKMFSGSGKQGKILLDWQKPGSLKPPTLWKYEVVYYPDGSPNDIKRIFVWNRGGDTKMTYAIERLSPAILYTVLLYCVVGEDSPYNREARSVTGGPLNLFTQPDNPVIKRWTQVTLTQVKIEWTAVERLDYYMLNLTRLYKPDSAIEFDQEFLTYNIDKDKTNVILKLSLGSSYRVVITAVVEKETAWMQSVVNSSNIKEFDTWSPYDSHQVFSRLVWKFSSCERLGRLGPSQKRCDFVYQDTSLDNLVTIEKGIQLWMAPIEGLYRVTAVGAGYRGPGGKGATVSGLFHLKEGEKIKIGVGQQGDSSGDMTQGGAGGTFVVTGDGTNEAMVIAGGAGTSNAGTKPLSISDGRLNHTAGDASIVVEGFGSGGTEQSMGPGLPGISNTAGGAGFYGTSKSAVAFGDTSFPAVGFLPYSKDNEMNDTETGSYNPLVGGRYESLDDGISEGGFGGGGSGYKTGAGGGGGYTGGGGGPANGHSGGGGSYIKYTGGPQYAEVENDQSGMVEITLVGLPVSSPIPVTLYLVVSFVVGIAMTVCCGGLMVCVDKCMGRRMRINNPELFADVQENKAATQQVYETSVHVTDASPTSSGLYVKNVNDEESYRKYSEVDSADNMPRLRVNIPQESTIEEDIRNDNNIVHKNPAIDDEDISSSDDDSRSESSASSIASIKSDLEDLTHDVYAWDITDDNAESDYSTDQQNGEYSLPPPPTPPPLHGLTTEEHRQNYRKNRLMFDNLENSMSF